MRIFSYRNKRRAKIVLAVLGCVVLAAALAISLRFIYLQRFLVYTDEGVTLNYEQDLQSDRAPMETTDLSEYPVQVMAPEDNLAVSSQANEEMKQLAGYYVTTAMLLDMPAVTEALEEQAPFAALMLDMKSIYGNFYYASGIPGAVQSSADIPAITAALGDLSSREDLYLIARVPSFSDNNFALANQSCGLPLSSGALWMDSEGCYWLDPLEEEVQDYLIAIARELSSLGFDEVVFDSFYVPDSSNIVYDQEVSRSEAAVLAAEAIRTALESDPIRVSFGSSDPQVVQYSDRVYLEASDGSAVAGLVGTFEDSLEDPSVQVVFLTASRDTRFEGYGILRPLIE